MNIIRSILVGVLIISSLMQLYLGIQLFTNTESLIQKFGIVIEKSSTDFGSIKILTTMIGKFLINFCIITVFTAFFVWKKNPAGLALALFFGLTMIVGGIISLKSGGGTLFILIDVLRGSIILILSLLLLVINP